METKNELSLEELRKLAVDPAGTPQLKDIVRRKRLEVLEARESIMES